MSESHTDPTTLRVAKKTAAKKSAPAPAPRRPNRTLAEKVQDELDAAERQVETLTTRRDRLKAELGPIEEELIEATENRDFLRGHPALKKAQKAGDDA